MTDIVVQFGGSRTRLATRGTAIKTVQIDPTDPAQQKAFTAALTRTGFRMALNMGRSLRRVTEEAHRDPRGVRVRARVKASSIELNPIGFAGSDAELAVAQGNAIRAAPNIFIAAFEAALQAQKEPPDHE